MVRFNEKNDGCYPFVKVVKGTNFIDYKIIDDDVELTQNNDLYIYIDFSNLSEYEILNDLFVYLSFTAVLNNTGSIRLKPIADYDHENENRYSSTDKGDITSPYLSVSLDGKQTVEMNITQIAMKQFSKNTKKINVRLKYYGEGSITIKSVHRIVNGTIETKQDLKVNKELAENTNLLINKSENYYYLIRPYQFEYSDIVFQNNIVFKYNMDLTLDTKSFTSNKFKLEVIDENKYLYTNDTGERFIYYKEEDDSNNLIEYVCKENDSKFSIDKDNDIYILSINGCKYEINLHNCNIQKITKGNKYLVFEYDENQKLTTVYKGSTNKTTTLTEFITISDTYITCESNNKKIKITNNGVDNFKIEEFDIDKYNNVSSKNYSLQFEDPQGSLDKITINEVDRYDFITDDNDNFVITNLMSQIAYTIGINEYYYYFSDNYNNIEKYYYNTKNEVIYYVKEKNGRIFEKKCIGYRDYEIKEQMNLLVENAFDDVEFTDIYQSKQNQNNEPLTENIVTNENIFYGLCNQEYSFNEISSVSERQISSFQIFEGFPNDVITLTMLSNVTLNNPYEHLIMELDVRYMTKDGIVPKTYSLKCKCKDNGYEFNSLKILAEQVFTSVEIRIKYNGINKCKISNIMLYKERSNNKVIYDDEYKVIGISQSDTTIITDYVDSSKFKIDNIKDNDGKYIEYKYNENNKITLQKNLDNQDYVEYEYSDDNLLISKKTKNDIYESIETYEYDELQNIVEETVDDKTNYYFNKIEQDKTIVQCINNNGLLNKQEEEVNSLSNIKSTKTFQLNDCYEKNKFHYENGVLKQIDTFDDKIYSFSYDSKNRITNIYIDNKLYINYTYSSVDFNAIEKKKYQDDNIIKFNYDNYGRITDVYKVNLSGTNTKKLASYEYDDLNRINKIKNSSNQIEKSYEYDELGNIIKCETPTHISIYVYNNDKELVDIKVEEKYNYKVFNSNTVSNSITIENVFKEFTKNIYCDYYFPNEKQETYGGNIILKEESDEINGEKNIQYDETLKRNIMLCNKEVYFKSIVLTSQLKTDSIIYNGKVFDLDNYLVQLSKKQGALGIFCFDLNNVYSCTLIKLTQSKYYNDNSLNLYIDNETKELILRKPCFNQDTASDYEDLGTEFYINDNTWHLIGLVNDAEHQKIGVIFDNKIQWFAYIVDFYTEININRYEASSIVPHDIVYKIAYLMYGYLDITEKELERLYINFNKVFNENKTQLITSNTYDVFDTQYLNKIPLNKSFTSYRDTKPWVIYTNDKFLNNSDRYFKCDSELNKYCYEASSYNESYLSYFIGNNISNLLISAQVKLLNKDFDTENTIYCVKDNSEKVKITYKYPNINVYINGELEQSFKVDFKLDKFNYVKTYINNNQLKITLNDTQYPPINVEIVQGEIGCKLIIGNDDCNNCFEGLISDVIYGNPQTDMDTNVLPTQFISKSDTQGRLRNKIIKTNNNSIQTTYSYYDKVKHDNVKTLNHLINRVKNHDGSEEIISYDENDSIIKRVLIKNDLVVRINNYTYDSFNRLIEEVRYEVDNNSNVLSETYKGVYEYDNYGNIIRNKTYKNSSLIKNIKLNYQQVSPHTLMNYVNEYNNSKYNVQYNLSVYPTKIGNNSITYEGSKIVKYGNNTYKYNTSGQRIQKITGNNKEYNYYYDNNNLIKQTCDNIAIDYIYNNSLLEGLSYNNEEFYYIRDITGCIEKIIDKDNNVMVLYKYTSYGEVEKIVNNQLDESRIQIANILKEYNGFVYKGYYYDVETQLFYCNSRYYSPELCRFISPDSIEYLDPESINGLNLYCYCLNNPIMYADPSGHWIETVFDILSLSASIVEVVINPLDVWAWAGLAGDAVDLIPFVTGVGEGIKGYRVVAKVADISDDALDAIRLGDRAKLAEYGLDIITFSRATDLTSDALSSINKLDNLGVDRRVLGINIHTGFMSKIPGKEFNEIVGIRPDYYNKLTHTLIELKPFNRNSLRRGVKQVLHYQDVIGFNCNKILEFYARKFYV